MSNARCNPDPSPTLKEPCVTPVKNETLRNQYVIFDLHACSASCVCTLIAMYRCLSSIFCLLETRGVSLPLDICAVLHLSFRLRSTRSSDSFNTSLQNHFLHLEAPSTKQGRHLELEISTLKDIIHSTLAFLDNMADKDGNTSCNDCKQCKDCNSCNNCKSRWT